MPTLLVLQSFNHCVCSLTSSPEPTNMLDVRAILWLENYLQVSANNYREVGGQWGEGWIYCFGETPGGLKTDCPPKLGLAVLCPFLRRGPPPS